MRFSIHREGKKILLSLFALMVTINLLTFQFVESQLVFLLVLFITSLTYILITQFFRNPRRYTEGVKETQILSPVDGKVVVIEEVYEGEYLHCNMRQISVFMSPTNVHVTRYPVGGMVEYSKYHPGKYLVAWHPKSSSENERTTVVIDNPTMGKILYRQIAGAMARRIVTYAKVGEKCHVDEQMGFIKFGSRVDVYLPIGTEVLVEMDQKVTGNQTPIARLG